MLTLSNAVASISAFPIESSTSPILQRQKTTPGGNSHQQHCQTFAQHGAVLG
jgi:hypothetical protein